VTTRKVLVLDLHERTESGDQTFQVL
jgi:hypothetical protein